MPTTTPKPSPKPKRKNLSICFSHRKTGARVNTALRNIHRWQSVHDMISEWVYYWQEGQGLAGCTKLDAERMARNSKIPGVGVGCEFGSFNWDAERQIGQDPRRFFPGAVDPVFDNGGKVHTLYLDNPLTKRIQWGDNPGLTKTINWTVDFLEWIQSQNKYREMGFVLVTTIPAWHYTYQLQTTAHNGGHATRKSGIYLKAALQAFIAEYQRRGIRLKGFKADVPYQHFVDNPAMPHIFRDISQMFKSRGMQFQVICQGAGGPPGQDRLHQERSLALMDEIRRFGIQVDMWGCQSFGYSPAAIIGENTQYSQTQTALRMLAKL